MTRNPVPVRGDLHYDMATHVWVDRMQAANVRVGLDPLGAETSGDIVALSFVAVGSRVHRGGAFGSVEAAKFVGPLIAPVSGVIRAHNDLALARPGTINSDPYGAWLVEIELADPAELAVLLSGEVDVVLWFAEERKRFEQKGMLAP